MGFDIVGLVLISGVLGPVYDVAAVVGELVVAVEVDVNVIATTVITVAVRSTLSL